MDGLHDGCCTQVSFAKAIGISSLSHPRLVKGMAREVRQIFFREWPCMVEVAAGTSAFMAYIAQRVALASF